MEDNVRCPKCQAYLTLPRMPAGQTVQCPRCQEVFAPAAQRVPATTSAPSRPRFDVDEAEDKHSEPYPVLAHIEPPRGYVKGIVVIVLLALGMLPSLFAQLYVDGERISLSMRTRAEEGPGQVQIFVRQFGAGKLNQEWIDLEQNIQATRLVHVLVFGITAFAFCFWIYQASANARLLQVSGLSHTPAGAVGWYFVPIANLFRPCNVMQEIWRSSEPSAIGQPHSWLQVPRSFVVRAWWLAWLAGILLRSAVGQGEFELDLDREIIAAWINAAGDLCMIGATGLLIAIIYRISTQQRERYEALIGTTE